MRHVPTTALLTGEVRHRRLRLKLLAAAIATIAGLTANAAPHATAAAAESEEPAAQEQSSQVPRRTEEQVRDAAITFRKKFGLAYDEASLAAANANPAPDAQHRYGVDLTPTEYADQVARDTWADGKGPLMDALQQRPDEFAGVWIDHASGGGFVVMALPSASPISKAAVAAAAPAGAPLRFATAEFSAATLAAAYDLLVDTHVGATAVPPTSGNPLVALRNKGFHVLGTGMQTSSNRLFVGVKGLAKERLGELEAAWDQHASMGALPVRAIVRFWHVGGNDPMESRYESPVTMKGGLQIYETLPDGFRRVCTSNMSSTGVVLTAAHCFGPDTDVFHARHHIARGLAYDGWYNGSQADVEALTLRVPRMASRFMFSAFECPGPYNVGETCQQVDKATGVHSGSYAEKERVCAGGATTYWIVCGEVQLIDYTSTMTTDHRGTVSFTDQAVASFEVNAGTSGGVVGLGGTVHGIVSGTIPEPECVTCIEGTSSTMQQALEVPLEPGWTIFSRMALAQSQMDRRIITTRTWLGVASAHAAGKCADVKHNLTTNGTPVWSWACDGNAAQRWQLEPYGTSTPEPNLWWTIKRYDYTSKCMDIDINAGDGAHVQEWDCNGQSQQIFRFDKYGYDWPSGGSDPSTFRILSMRTGKCIDLAGGGIQDGTKIQQWGCVGATQQNQYWRTW